MRILTGILAIGVLVWHRFGYNITEWLYPDIMKWNNVHGKEMPVIHPDWRPFRDLMYQVEVACLLLFLVLPDTRERRAALFMTSLFVFFNITDRLQGIKTYLRPEDDLLTVSVFISGLIFYIFDDKVRDMVRRFKNVLGVDKSLKRNQVNSRDD